MEFVIAPGLELTGDGNLLELALENLLGNAWKFTNKHERARIEFGAAVLEGGRVFFVRDDGAGFDMVSADKLFNAFQRYHGSTEFPGSGIGLATVKRIVHRHAGRIWAEAAVERGATFYFTIGSPAQYLESELSSDAREAGSDGRSSTVAGDSSDLRECVASAVTSQQERRGAAAP